MFRCFEGVDSSVEMHHGGPGYMLCKQEMTGRPQPPQHLFPYFYTGAQIPFSPVAPKEPHYLYR